MIQLHTAVHACRYTCVHDAGVYTYYVHTDAMTELRYIYLHKPTNQQLAALHALSAPADIQAATCDPRV